MPNKYLKQVITNGRSSYFTYVDGQCNRINKSAASFYMSAGRFSHIVIETKIPEFGIDQVETVNLRHAEPVHA